MNPTVVVVAPEAFVATAATAIADRINAAIAARGGCSLALSGGSTPALVYRQLASHAINWSKLSIWFGDERAVSPVSPDSNYAMAAASLFDIVAIPGAQIHRMAGERADLGAAAAEYEQVLPPQLDILLLGIGPDGHTASLFPHSPALGEGARRVVAVASPPLPLQPQVARITITASVIDAAHDVIVLVRGSDKAAILRRVLEGPANVPGLPAQLARRGTWIVDQDAATQLQSRNS